MVTLKDIARELNLSYSTVSLCLNSSDRVSPETMRRVKETARRMGYAPNARARAFVRKQTQLIGIVVPDIANPFFSSITRGAEAVATDRDYRVMILNTDRRVELEERHLRLVVEGQVDGLLVTSIDNRSSTLERILDEQFPLVFVNNPYPGRETSFAGADGFETGRIAATHLVELGHREIAVAGVEPMTQFQRRLMEGFRHALSEAGIPWDRAHRVDGEFSVTSGYETGRRIVKRVPNATAVFAFDDLIALGVMRALEERGRRVPEDVSLVGCDDVFLASLPRIELTTVRLHTEEMGRVAAQTLLAQIARRREGAEYRTERRTLPSELIVRRTTAPAKGR